MELKQLLYFYEVSNRKSFSNASNSLYISQQAISKSIRSLEEYLGVSLFIRSATGISLTEEGIYLKKRCEELFAFLDETEQSIRQISPKKDQTFTIGIINGTRTIFPLAFVDQYNEAHPNLHFSFRELKETECDEALKNGLIQGAITAYPKQAHLFQVRPFCKQPLCAVMNQSNPLASKTHLCLKDFIHHHLILITELQHTNEIMLRAFHEKHIPLNVSYDASNLLSAFALCRENKGILILMQKTLDTLSYPDIQITPIELTQLQWELYSIYKSNDSGAEELTSFFNYLQEHLNDPIV